MQQVSVSTSSPASQDNACSALWLQLTLSRSTACCWLLLHRYCLRTQGSVWRILSSMTSSTRDALQGLAVLSSSGATTQSSKPPLSPTEVRFTYGTHTGIKTKRIVSAPLQQPLDSFPPTFAFRIWMQNPEKAAGWEQKLHRLLFSLLSTTWDHLKWAIPQVLPGSVSFP